MARKLASVQEIRELRPIEGADRIEVAVVNSWQVIVQKSLEYKVGDKVIFIEPDALLPEDNPLFEEFQKRGQKKQFVNGKEVAGHVLRTIKMRGNFSQGLILPLDRVSEYLGEDLESLEVGSDVTNTIPVYKYEPPFESNSEAIGAFDTTLAPKTDAIRVQNLTKEWEEIKKLTWDVSLKLDGTSQTLANDGGKIRIFSRNLEVKKESSLGFETASRAGLVDYISREENVGMAIQFELIGPGIQSNRLKLDTNRVAVFSVWKDRVRVPRAFWDEEVLAVAAPKLEGFEPTGTIDEMMEKVDGLRGVYENDVLEEGIVYQIASEETPIFLDSTGNWKIINRKFLVKNGE